MRITGLEPDFMLFRMFSKNPMYTMKNAENPYL